MPAAFWSAISITTTSASDLSATPRATVAPTLPAPPTTVNFRFIASNLLLNPSANSTLKSSHVADNRIRELGRLQFGGATHLARQVVGDLLLADGPFETALDEGSGFGPPEVVEHHHARQNHRSGVDDILAGILGRGAVGGLEEGDVVA